MSDLSNYRKSYDKNELLEDNIPSEPFELFDNWFKAVENSKSIEEVNAMTVATIGQDGFPRSRVVLLKSVSNDGFVFYTNYESEKGKAITNNPNVCLSFFWQSQEQQVIIKGIAKKVSQETSEKYFNSRPIGSKLGAIVSNQSQVIENRKYLENKLDMLEKKYQNQEIPMPDFWGGFIVEPISIEFWQGRPNRLHDRIRYSLQADKSWKIDRLSP